VAFTTLIEKLQVRMKVHPTPYTLQWLTQGNEVTISKQTLITFSVGPYYGEVLCDVLSMDACHILFGRPWLFDNYVMHDGHAMPLSLGDIASPWLLYHHPKLSKLNQVREVRKSSTLVNVERAINKRKHLFVILMVESNTSEMVKPLHPLTQSFLREFEDVFPNDLLSGLCLFRGIEHQIDLLTSAPLPNKTAYRCNPSK